MEALLSYSKGTSAARHRITKNAQAAFAELEQWMGECKRWEQALQNTRAEAEAQKSPTTTKKTVWKAPGLLSSKCT